MDSQGVATPAKRTFKVCVFGDSKSGKSLLIDFLKHE